MPIPKDAPVFDLRSKIATALPPLYPDVPDYCPLPPKGASKAETESEASGSDKEDPTTPPVDFSTYPY